MMVKKWKQVLNQAFRSHIYYVISQIPLLNMPNVDRSQMWIIFPLLFLPKHLFCYNPSTIKPRMETCIYAAGTPQTFAIHMEILSMICIFQGKESTFNITQFGGIFYISRVIPSYLNWHLNFVLYKILHVPKTLLLSGTETNSQRAVTPTDGGGTWGIPAHVPKRSVTLEPHACQCQSQLQICYFSSLFSVFFL